MLTLRLKTLLGILVTAFLLTGAGAAGATTISLLHMDGTPGSQTFTDETGKGWTAAGDAQISAAQAKWGQSAYFDGTSDYLVANDSSYFFPGT